MSSKQQAASRRRQMRACLGSSSIHWPESPGFHLAPVVRDTPTPG
ncbi:hypothetical protein [Silvimonas amylolytica]|nr:hypothetical protein [Silvimonas amylolytica]